MGYFLFVAVGNGLEHLLGHDCGFLFDEATAGNNFIEEFPSVAEFSYQKNAVFVFVHFVQPHDVGVDQVFEDVNLVLQAHLLAVPHLVLVNDLYGALLARLLARTLLDSTEGALSQNVGVQLIKLREGSNLLVLDNEVTGFGDYVILGVDHPAVGHRLEFLKS
jgi:hypothetical protein